MVKKLAQGVQLSRRIAVAMRRGEIALALRELAKIAPDWLFRFNKAYAVVADDLWVAPAYSNDIYVRMATLDDVDAITRINHMSPERVRTFLSNGAVAFLAGTTGKRPGAVLFRVSGKCYIQGLSWTYDFGPDGSYCFGVYTAPEARNKGLQSALVAAQAEYEHQLGTRHFYRLLEFTNELAYSVAYHLGYRPAMTIYHFQLFNLRCAIEKSLRTGKATWHFMTKHPNEKYLLRI